MIPFVMFIMVSIIVSMSVVSMSIVMLMVSIVVMFVVSIIVMVVMVMVVVVVDWMVDLMFVVDVVTMLVVVDARLVRHRRLDVRSHSQKTQGNLAERKGRMRLRFHIFLTRNVTNTHKLKFRLVHFSPFPSILPGKTKTNTELSSTTSFTHTRRLILDTPIYSCYDNAITHVCKAMLPGMLLLNGVFRYRNLIVIISALDFNYSRVIA